MGAKKESRLPYSTPQIRILLLENDILDSPVIVSQLGGLQLAPGQDNPDDSATDNDIITEDDVSLNVWD